jgi:hypothetical protein
MRPRRCGDDNNHGLDMGCRIPALWPQFVGRDFGAFDRTYCSGITVVLCAHDVVIRRLAERVG